MFPPPPRSTLFPYTTLFRSLRDGDDVGLAHRAAQGDRELVAAEPSHLCARAGCGLDARRHVTQQLVAVVVAQDRKSTRLNSSHSSISYAVFCLKKKKKRS